MLLDDLVGLPWRDCGRDETGVDCYGLVVLAYRGMLGIDLPSYSDRYVTSADRAVLGALIEGEKGNWTEIAAGEERPMDVLLMMQQGVAQHVGVIVKPGLVLHIQPDSTALIENYRRSRLRDRIAGFFRFAP